MSTLSVKQQAHSLIEGLPEDCTWDDVMHQVYLILAVEAGLADSKLGKTRPVDEVRSQCGLQP